MKFLIFFYLALQIVAIKSKILSDDIFPIKCHRSDPNVKSCLYKQLDKILHKVVGNGLPKYNVPKLDPIEVPFIAYERTIENLISVNGTFKNTKFIGLSNFVLTDIKYKDDGQSIVGELACNHPHMYIASNMNVFAKIFDTPIRFEGYAQVNMTNITSRLQISYKTYLKGGVKYFTLTKFKVKSTVEGCHIAMKTTNSEDQALIDYAVNYFNANAKEVIAFLVPYFAEEASSRFSSEIEKVASTVPAEKLIPE